MRLHNTTLMYVMATLYLVNLLLLITLVLFWAMYEIQVTIPIG